MKQDRFVAKRSLRGRIVQLWAYISVLSVAVIVIFLFGYIFWNGKGTINKEFLTQYPSGAVLGSEGGIYPAIIGSLCFTGMSLVVGGIPALALAIYKCFFCKKEAVNQFLNFIIQCTAGIPSIVLGLFSYSLLVRELEIGRCILSSGIALGIMVLPFIEVRIEKAFQEVPKAALAASTVLGCSQSYTVWKIVLPACRGEIVSAFILGGCFAAGATAPLIFTGGVAFARLPESVFSPAMALPLHLYLLVAQGATSLPMAYGTAFVMMLVLLVSNFLANLYGRRHKMVF